VGCAHWAVVSAGGLRACECRYNWPKSIVSDVFQGVMSSQARPAAPPYERYYRVLGIGDALTGLHSQLHHLSVTLFGSTFCGGRVWTSLEWSGVLRRMQPDFTEGRAVP
jgi:hypothetical protein